ncbi:MAG TPA: SDR family oxidoreductase [Azospirillum sp.]
MRITDCTAVVTGANRGIGRALVDALLARGARRVYAAARSVRTLDVACLVHGARIAPVALDVGDADGVRRAAALARDATLLINNAGVLSSGSLLEVPEGAVRADMEVNLFGTLAMVRAFVPVIRANGGGAIANILSVSALAATPSLGAYSASKAAALSVTQSVRADAAPMGITVHGVFPGPVATDMSRAIDIAKADPNDVAAAILDGLEAGEEDIFPDGMARQVGNTWRSNPLALARQFATL